MTMDRSVDSIGSCSLDVDADSTDFSDTSGSLNLATPSSGKDIPREFTARIKERCQLSQITSSGHHQTAVVLDPTSGKINTIVSCTTVESPISSPAKKPSYLNLACCVNGYSNLTTYDSKLRQNINKSREVSPIRPSTNSSVQTNRLSGNFLAVPLIAYGQKSPQSSTTVGAVGAPSSAAKGSTTNIMENRHIFSQVHHHDLGVDATDNIASEVYFKSSKFISSANLKTTETIENESKTTKSFIQQRVERLYGPGALAQGFYSPKKTKSQELSILSERSSNSQIKYSTKTIQLEREITSSTINGKTTTSSTLERTATTASSENCENLQNGNCDLPVLRHLRPEFRAQLPIVSPKRSPNKVSVNESSSCPSLQNGTAAVLHVNGNNNKLASIANDKLASGTTITVHYDGQTESRAKPATAVTIVSATNGTAKVDNTVANDTVAVVPKSAVSSLKTNVRDSSLSQKVTQEEIECDKEKLSTPISSSSVQEKQQSQPVQQEEFLTSVPVPVTEESTEMMTVFSMQPVTETKKTNGLGASIVTTDEMTFGANPVIRNGNYFLKILKTEQERLLRMADNTEKELETLLGSSTVSDEIFGYLRSASGKARLLASQKMKQFEGLCKNNLNQLPNEKFPTTNEDLQGFWDMVMLQVTHVDSLFKEIENLRANNWQKPPQEVPTAPQGSKLTRRPNATKSSAVASSSSAIANGTNSPKKQSAAASLAAQRREAQRKQLLEMKRKNKLAMQSSGTTTDEQQSNQKSQVVEIFVNDQCSS